MAVEAPRRGHVWQETCKETCKATRQAISLNTTTHSEKFSGNDKYGTGSLVAGEGTVADDCGRGRLYELVCAHGLGRRAGRKRASVGADPVPQELDPGALRRPR